MIRLCEQVFFIDYGHKKIKDTLYLIKTPYFLQLSHDQISPPVSRGVNKSARSGSFDTETDAEYKPNVSAVDASYR